MVPEGELVGVLVVVFAVPGIVGEGFGERKLLFAFGVEIQPLELGFGQGIQNRYPTLV